MTRKSNTSITIRDVAKQAGVSVATVSRFINDSAPVSEDVAGRIQKVMSRLKYVPHAPARQLASQKTLAVGFLLNTMYNDFFGPLLYGIESVVQQNGYNLLVATTRPGKRFDGFPPLGAHNTDGLLVFADTLTDDDLKSLHQHGLPIVLIHRSSPKGMDIPSVTVENKAATKELIEHLIKVHGRRRIIFMRGPEHQEDSRWRETGYQKALEENGIKFDPELVLNGDFERDIAYLSLKSFLAKPNRPKFDAVFAGDDSAAIGAMDALHEFGLRIPEDVAVVGFNDMRQSSFLKPPLTTIKAPTHEVGRTAAKNLFSLITNQHIEPVSLLSTEIIIRQSCGCTG